MALTEGSGRRMRDAGSAVTLIGSMVRVELADRAVWWSSWLRISTGRHAVVLRRYNGGQGGTGLTGGEKSSGGRTHPGGSRVEIPVLAGLGPWEIELGEAPGPETEWRRWLSVAEVLRNGQTTAAKGVCSVEQRRGGG